MRSKAFRVFLHVVIWLAIYLLPFFISHGTISRQVMLEQPGGIIHILSTLLLVVYTYFNYNLLIPRLYFRRRYVLYAVVVMASLLAVIWLPHLTRLAGWSHRMPVPSGGPVMPRHPSGGRPMLGPPTEAISKVGYNIVLFIICTFASISIRQQQQLLEAQREKLGAELSFLKAQINPHFLFNTLNSIYALSIRKSDETPRAIIQLADLMRYILKDADTDMVPLDKELSYISNYVALQQQRLGDTVQIRYTAPAATDSRPIAPLILTSFIENAFKHGVNPDEDSVIDIVMTTSGSQLQLLVMNNKVSSVNPDETMGIGLKNAVSRLAHLYPGKHQLVVDDGESVFTVNLTIELS